MTNQWPPKATTLSYRPMPVPYLSDIPDVVDLAPGRQLFVDDYLVQNTDLKRVFHHAKYHQAGPVIAPDRPWEGRNAYAFSGGAWFDPSDELFKLWYKTRRDILCLATSRDGIEWEKPELDAVQPKTNIVLRCSDSFDSVTVWLDYTDVSERRYKYFATERGEKGWELVVRTSPDGVHWSDPLASQRIYGDRTTCFYNPFREVWAVSLRIDAPKDEHDQSVASVRNASRRARGYLEDPDPLALVQKAPYGNIAGEPPEQWGEAVLWCGADELDPRNPDPEYAGIEPHLYTLDAAPYESLMLGLFSIWQGPENNICREKRVNKRNDILVGFSRDGFHWHRPDRNRFISCTNRAGDWNARNVQSVGGCCLVVGDKLHFHMSGVEMQSGGKSSTGLATLRRDGFASMDAGAAGGTLTTRPICFTGGYLFVNLDAPKGKLLVEVLDREGKIVEPFTTANCVPLAEDSTAAAVAWKGAPHLSTVAGSPVRLRFHLENGRLYSFWVSASAAGASGGYVAAGGPGFAGASDTAGRVH
jgi:hypothetical protein